ncbi:unnamed protein product [Mytilus coruscus]|uniref:Uncharacterized protein n=1 Tax=Mytilus coruscus TaxID=42192 RepID=A0A6J8DK12_MYTCO|nr:unnamed protein product [Mytilus coruscus]
MIEISEAFKVAIEVLRDLHVSTDEDLTKLTTKRVTLQSIKTEVQARYSEEKQGILHQEKILNELVHEQSEKLISKLDVRLNKMTISMQADEYQTNEDYRATESRNQIFLDALDSNNVLKIFKTVGNENRANKTKVRIVGATKYKSLPKFLPGYMEQKAIATFYETLVDIPAQPIPPQEPPQFELFNQYRTTLPLIQCIVCCPNGSLWISNFTSNEMQNISLIKDGSTQLNKNVKLSEVASMQLNKSDLILSLKKSNLCIFQPETGKLVSSKYTVAPLFSNSALHISKNKKIIVGAKEDGPIMFPPNGPRKVIVMNMEGEHEMTYYLDNKGRPIFTLPFRITTDNNNDIFVIDLLSELYGRVVKLDKWGGISSIYLGNPAIKDPFTPRDLKITLCNNVIVTDSKCNSLHVLNNKGSCMHYVRIDREFGIYNPLSLEFDNKGVLFIGTQQDNYCSEANIYEVKISGV